MANLLDLRNKVNPQVKIIYKIITQKQPWYVEFAKIAAVIVVVGTVVWGVSRADELFKTPAKNFSAYGLISANVGSSISINEAHGSDSSEVTSYTFDVGTVNKIETNKYAPLEVSDLKIGDKIMVQGMLDNSVIIARRIVSFTSTSTATTTEALASTTLEVSTTTSTTTSDIASSTATSTPSFMDQVVGTIGDTINGIVDAITGKTKATTTEEIATTTPTTPEVTATTSEQVTPPTSPAPEVTPVTPAPEVVTPPVVPAPAETPAVDTTPAPAPTTE